MKILKKLKQNSMRKAFLQTLTKLAESDPRVILIVGDVGFSFIEEFAARFPNQYINAGVTEQAFMGMAAGLAACGWKPYVYSMIPFVTFRNYEQLRNDVCYNNLNVKLIGVRGSVHYKFLGISHNIEDDEDKKVLKHLPNLGCLFPQNPEEVVAAMENAYNYNGPVYFRL